MVNSYYLAKARSCREKAEHFKAIGDHKTMMVCLATARTWEIMAGGGPGWSHKPEQQQLAQLKADAAAAVTEAIGYVPSRELLPPPAPTPKAAPAPEPTLKLAPARARYVAAPAPVVNIEF